MSLYHKIFLNIPGKTISKIHNGQEITVFQPDDMSMSVGDSVYKVSSSMVQAGGITYSGNQQPQLLGTITKIVSDGIYVYTDQSGTLVNSGEIIMYAKNSVVNKSGIKGYYAQIKMKVEPKNNESIPYSELFSVGSEITPSSK